jgi:hypothetical protein
MLSIFDVMMLVKSNSCGYLRTNVVWYCREQPAKEGEGRVEGEEGGSV